MGKYFYVDEDEFARTFSDLMGDVSEVAGEALFKGTRDGCVLGRDEWKDGAPVRTGKYQKSITYRTVRTKDGVEGHIYSKRPGMPHLLEKGHATLGGGRTRAFPHVMPAAREAFEYTPERVMEYIREGLT